MSDPSAAGKRPPPPPRAKTVPHATALTQPFWEGADRQQLMLQVSTADGRAQFFPRPHGLASAEPTRWTAASGDGVLVAVTVCRVPAPGYEGEAPYAMGIVQLAEGPRVLAQIATAAPHALAVGMPVRLAWDLQRAGHPVYLFEPT